jgi:hypothetical protein
MDGMPSRNYKIQNICQSVVFEVIQNNECLHSNTRVRIYNFYLWVLHPIYKTIILPVVLYGCETWLLILREKHRLRVFENRVWTEEG